MKDYFPLGIFDSGVGGLSIFKEVRNLLPNLSILYFADQMHIPYGTRNVDEIRSFSTEISRFLISQGVQVIIVACNTASAAALTDLRSKFPNTTFVGMEPAVKPAAEYTRSGIVGVLATPATFHGVLYSSVVKRFGQGKIFLQATCPGLVQQIERGEFQSPITRRILEKALLPMLKKQVDTIVLGCTHYPFVVPLIQEIVGPKVHIIDPSLAVAKQAFRVLEKRAGNLSTIGKGDNVFITSGDKEEFTLFLSFVIGIRGEIMESKWVNGIVELHSTNNLGNIISGNDQK